jgi:hypothetical protein
MVLVREYKQMLDAGHLMLVKGIAQRYLFIKLTEFIISSSIPARLA